MKLLVLVERITPRVEYAFGHVLAELLHAQFELTTSASEYVTYSGPKFSYGVGTDESLHFGAVGLLLEEGIQTFEPDHSRHKDIPTYFAVGAGALPFDPFAATFYTLSRYEEYTTPERDEHGRFQADRSTLTRIGALEIPVIDHWAKMVADQLNAAFPDLKLKLQPGKDLFTVDVDNAFAYKGRGIRSKAAVVKAQLKGKGAEAKERKAVLSGSEADPYDNYAAICEVVGDKDALIFFVLFAQRGPNDHGADPNDHDFHEAIRAMASGARVGVHPSYASNDIPGEMEEQIAGLGKVTGSSVKMSRQHFLRFDLPKTYRRLTEAGIKEEYSMGYADRPGFRAGTCRPFKWYDLEREEATDLSVVPFATMDTAFADHMGLSAEEAKDRIDKIRKNLKAVDGPLISVWHDRVLADREPYEGWWKIFNELLQGSSNKQNLIVSKEYEGYHADCFVLAPNRSIGFIQKFLDNFIPHRSEMADEYHIPQYSEHPDAIFNSLKSTLDYLVTNQTSKQTIYWRNEETSELKGAIAVFTEDGFLIVGLFTEVLVSDDSIEKKYIERLKKFCHSEIAHIYYEDIPPHNANRFREFVNRSI